MHSSEGSSGTVSIATPHSSSFRQIQSSVLVVGESLTIPTASSLSLWLKVAASTMCDSFMRDRREKSFCTCVWLELSHLSTLSSKEDFEF